MTKKKPTIHTLALRTIEELKRRGWTTGTLSQDTYCFDDGQQISVPEEHTKVCAVGAMSSAYNPFHPRWPGYGDDYPQDIEYDKFLTAVAAEIPDIDKDGHPSGVIVHFNDTYASGVDEVIALFQRVADKHKPKTRAKKVKPEFAVSA